MFAFALLLGIYSYIIFTLGITGLLYKNVIILFTLVFWVVVLVWKKRRLILLFTSKVTVQPNGPRYRPTLFVLIFFLFILQIIVNLIGALGPELAFDALWYHLTLPKLYLENHKIFFIPGGLLYYSAMPQLGEMLYTAVLAFDTEILAKIIHLSFGLLTCLAIYKLERKFLSPLVSMIGVIIFYSNLVVAWESTTAYIDLIRTFFEVMALWAFIDWWQNGKRKWIALSAAMVGLSITTKLLAVGSLLIFSVIIIFFELKKLLSRPKIQNTLYLILNTFARIFAYLFIALAVPLPWFIFSYLNTGNPVYPFFTPLYTVTPEPLTIFGFFKEILYLFTSSPDPLSPLYFIFLPIIIFSFSKFKLEIKIIALYSILSLIVWYFTPRTGGGRFIIPYLPAFSILCAAAYSHIVKNTGTKYTAKFLVTIIIFVSLITIGYRFAANSKYIPVLLGRQTRQEFLANHLNFAFGDFYDTDNFFKENIKETDKVLLLGFHNLYYVNFPFIDASWQKEGDRFNYIATQNTQLPEKYKNWELIYKNDQTMVKLYKQSMSLRGRSVASPPAKPI